MIIDITKEQFLKLSRMIFLGNWMINAYSLAEQRDIKYNQIAEDFYKLAAEYDITEYEEWKKTNISFEDFLWDDSICDQAIQNYNENAFWERLARKLADYFTVEHEKRHSLKLSNQEKSENAEYIYDELLKIFDKRKFDPNILMNIGIKFK